MRKTGWMTALCLALTASAAGADMLSSKNRATLFSSQTKLLDGRAAQQYQGSARLLPPSARISLAEPIPTYRGSYRGPYLQMARAAAARHGVPEDLFLRLVQQESNWNPAAVSSKGAQGLAQLMPDTARGLGVDPSDAYENLDGGARYLAEQYRSFGTWRLALAAYNAGPGAVRTHGGVPPFRETQGYIRAILGG